MKINYLFVIFSTFFIYPALAQTVPFFASNGTLNQSATNGWYVSNGWSDGAWNGCWWKFAEIGKDGNNLKLSIQSKVDFTGAVDDIPAGKLACGEIQSWTRQNYGTYTVTMKTVSGAGLNTAFFTYNANPHDEIDFEFLGLHPTQVSINYWVGGVNQSLAPVNLGFDASQAFHTYSLIYTPTSLTWLADGKQLFQTKSGAQLPTSLARMYLEFWAGAASENGWLGAFTYTKPVSAEYSSVSFTPYIPSGTH